MALSTSITLDTTFDLSGSTKVFKLTDTTDYATEGVALSDVVGIFTIIDPTGATVYSNSSFVTPDIDADVSLEFNTVELPLDIHREVLKGTYKIQYSIEVSGGVQPGQYTIDSEYNYSLDVPCLKLDVSYDLEQATLTSVDVTDYGDYVTTVNRTHTLIPPAGSGLSNTTSTLARVTAAPIATKTWTAKIESEITVTLDGLNVTYLLDGQKEITVVGSTGSCDLHNCIEAIHEKYESQKNHNPTLAEATRKELDDAMMYYNLYRIAMSCGELEKANEYRGKILVCTDNCGCDASSCCDTSNTSCDTSISEVINPNQVTTIAGPQGNPGPAGTDGTALPGTPGADGAYGGYSQRWLWDASTGNPDPTNMTFNNSDPSLTTVIKLAEFNADFINVSDFSASFENGGAYGWLKIFKENDVTKYYNAKVTSVTDQSAYFELTVEYIDHNSTFTGGDSIVVSFTPAGASAAGNDGVVVLYNDTTDVVVTQNGNAVMKNYVMPAGTLANDGDKIKITALLSKDTDANFKGSMIYLDSDRAVSPLVYFPTSQGVVNQRIEVTITRKSNTEVYSEAVVHNSSSAYIINGGNLIQTNPAISTLDLDNNPYDIQLTFYGDGVNDVTAHQLTVDYYKKQ